MAILQVNQLPDADSPILGTDIILVSRNGVDVKKTSNNALPVSTAVQTALDLKQNLRFTVNLVSSRNSLTTDSGAEPIFNSGTSNYTYTVVIGTITQPTYLQQENTGTITLVAGAGVTFVGTSLATTGAGSILTILPTSTPNRYIVIKGGL